MNRLFSITIVGLFTCLLPIVSSAQILVCDPATSTSYTWPSAPVAYFTDGGVTGAIAPIPTFTLADADFLTDMAFMEWSSVSTSTFTAVDGGTIAALPPGYPGNIDATNVGLIFDPGFSTDVPNDPGIYIIYDDDGAIASLVGAPPGVLGFATPELADPSTCTIVEAYAVLNLGEIDPLDVPPTYAFPGANFGGVFTHEIGHSINLAHKQTVGNVFFTSLFDTPLPAGCIALPAPAPPGPSVTDLETMNPFLDVSGTFMTGAAQAEVTTPDDMAAISDLYPAGGWPATTGVISGVVVAPDGVTPLGGVNVVARNVEDPYADAISQLSGAGSQTAGDGSYTLTGLTPGEVYVLFVEPIVAGAFSQSPVVPFPDGAPEEFWNGPDETNIGFPGAAGEDTPCDTVKIVPVAGTPFMADILLNDPTLGAPFAADILELEAIAFGKKALVSWISLVEDNHDKYVVQLLREERLADWKDLGAVHAAGEGARYEFLTDALSPGFHQFRLKEVDLQGNISFSQTTEVYLSGEEQPIAIFPNPASHSFSLECYLPVAGTVSCEIFDLSGKKILNQLFSGEEGMNQQKVSVEEVPVGTYLLVIKGDGLIHRKMIEVRR